MLPATAESGRICTESVGTIRPPGVCCLNTSDTGAQFDTCQPRADHGTAGGMAAGEVEARENPDNSEQLCFKDGLTGLPLTFFL